jgi:SNF2 family DNA or RNA helicase
MEPGTGKSKVILDDAARLYREGKIRLLVVVAPNGVHHKWVDHEVPTHCSAPWRAMAIESGRQHQYYHQILKGVRDIRDCLHILTVGFGALSSATLAARCIQKAVQLAPCMVVADEASRIKSPSSVRTKATISLGKRATFRRTLSGTPVTNGLQDLYAQFKFLDGSDRSTITGVSTFSAFKGMFCKMGGFEGRQIVGYQNTDLLRERIAPYIYEVKKEDCLDLPPKRYERASVQLSPEQKKHYKSVKDDMLLELGDGTTVDIPQAITRLLRLQQIVGGFLPDGTRLACPRLDELVDRVSADVESDLSVIIWARFRPETIAIAEGLAKKSVFSCRYTGGQTELARKTFLSDFQKKTYPVLIGTQAAGGIGLDMTAASRVYYYSNTFGYEDRIQSEDRAHRIGQNNPVIYTDLHAAHTVDDLILKALRRKQDVAALISVKELKEC